MCTLSNRLWLKSGKITGHHELNFTHDGIERFDLVILEANGSCIFGAIQSLDKLVDLKL